MGGACKQALAAHRGSPGLHCNALGDVHPAAFQQATWPTCRSSVRLHGKSAGGMLLESLCNPLEGTCRKLLSVMVLMLPHLSAFLVRGSCFMGILLSSALGRRTFLQS